MGGEKGHVFLLKFRAVRTLAKESSNEIEPDGLVESLDRIIRKRRKK